MLNLLPQSTHLFFFSYQPILKCSYANTLNSIHFVHFESQANPTRVIVIRDNSFYVENSHAILNA